jgi:hypothetical protein
LGFCSLSAGFDVEIISKLLKVKKVKKRTKNYPAHFVTMVHVSVVCILSKIYTILSM